MSENKIQSCIRFHISSYTSNEYKSFLMSHFYIDFDDYYETLDYFNEDVGEFVPRLINDKIFIDYIIENDSSYNVILISISDEMIKEVIQEFKEIFNLTYNLYEIKFLHFYDGGLNEVE